MPLVSANMSQVRTRRIIAPTRAVRRRAARRATRTGRCPPPAQTPFDLGPGASRRHSRGSVHPHRAVAASRATPGWLLRPGVDVRYRASGAVTLLVQGQTAFGRVADNGRSVSLVGPRAVVLLEWAR